jgi:hypothetical protein
VLPPHLHPQPFSYWCFGFQQRRWRAAERRHPTGRERLGSPTLQTLQDPILGVGEGAQRCTRCRIVTIRARQKIVLERGHRPNGCVVRVASCVRDTAACADLPREPPLTAQAGNAPALGFRANAFRFNAVNPYDASDPPPRNDTGEEASIFSRARMRSHLALPAVAEHGGLVQVPFSQARPLFFLSPQRCPPQKQQWKHRLYYQNSLMVYTMWALVFSAFATSPRTPGPYRAFSRARMRSHLALTAVAEHGGLANPVQVPLGLGLGLGLGLAWLAPNPNPNPGAHGRGRTRRPRQPRAGK